jgi:hypothetical protein
MACAKDPAMAKVQFELAPVKLTGKPALRKKRVRQSSGKVISVYALNAQSTTLATDLTAAFAKNVAAARKANATIGEGANLTKSKRAKK